jgi:hypothetical protein
MNRIPLLEQAPPAGPERPWGVYFIRALAAIFAAACGMIVLLDVLEDTEFLRRLTTWWTQRRMSAGIVEEYTRFRTEQIDAGEVVTGYRFKQSTDTAPEGQYCYLLLKQRGTPARLQVRIATREPEGTIAYDPITPDVASAAGVSVDGAAEIARQKCRFNEWE